MDFININLGKYYITEKNFIVKNLKNYVDI
jgi:hypothetical protein